MGLFNKIFRFLREPVETYRAEVMAGGSTFTPFSGNAYESDIYIGLLLMPLQGTLQS